MVLRFWVVLNVLVIVSLGSLLHFVYEWSDKSPAVAWFAAVNESVAEHEKLLTIPFLLMTLIGTWLPVSVPGDRDYWFSRALGLICGLTFIPWWFYIYTQARTQSSFLAVDLTLFLLAVILSQVVSVTLGPLSHPFWTRMGQWICIVLFGLTVVFSYRSPPVEPWVH